MTKLLILLSLLSVGVYAQKSDNTFRGRVIDVAHHPIQYASIIVNDNAADTYSNENGEFSIRAALLKEDSLRLKISFVGRQTIYRTISKSAYRTVHTFVLQELSLTLNNVIVSPTAVQSDVSNSSIRFDRQAIEQVQAYSLADILNNLPGKKMSAPDLQYRQGITLRSAASEDPVQATNNAMGVGIFIDGFRQGNDANMQGRNVGLRGYSNSGITNRRDPYQASPSYDSPFGGIDIRNIPADHIESIEVVSGVASAKYSEITDGAIIIERKAGQTPFNFTMRLNGYSTNYSISKGISLGKKAGALNFNLNYLNSVQDPTNYLKNYKRITGGLMWTTNFSKTIRNTLSVDYSYKKDFARVDPDDQQQTSTIASDRNISFKNRTSLKLESPLVKNITLGISYDKGYTESYSQYLINKSVETVADKDTTGIYEGYFSPGNYLAIDHIIGEPYNFSANLSADNHFKTGMVSHTTSIGASFYSSGNSGAGIIADPGFPPTARGSSMKSERPYNFDLQQPVRNGGFYVQEQARYMLFNRLLTANAGMRYDLQNGYASIQPRINTSYQLSNKWSLRAAYGIATKSPGMSQRNPPPTYFDIPLLNVYNSNINVNQNLYLVYTQKIDHDNSDLKPSKSSQMELGASASYHFFNTSIYGYWKKNRDGFNTLQNFVNITLPVYSYTLVDGQKPQYYTTGAYRLYSGLYDNAITNSSQSDNYGIEWFVSTQKIPSLQTSLSMNTSYSFSRYNNLGYRVVEVAESFRLAERTAWYGIYPATKLSQMAITTKITTDTHIPRLGFIVSLSADIYWKNKSSVLGKSNEPIGYLDKYQNYFPISNFDPSNQDYGYLALTADKATTNESPPFAYGNMSLRIAKEMRKKLRVSVFAYNFLNIIPRHYNEITQTYSTYNSPVNVGAEISIKF
ncbi:TonB-dependent receptor [Pedobacter sp. AW31-3R]|uniref:TonB-dependent receptor n=1 Tax=Pedobacter sp. AW31-3R TaxID=3445781 RepID=UPI003FA1345A